MEKTTIIEFNPQNEKDTLMAIDYVYEKQNEEKILLKPVSNLIDVECLNYLTNNKFYIYNSWNYGKVFKLLD